MTCARACVPARTPARDSSARASSSSGSTKVCAQPRRCLISERRAQHFRSPAGLGQFGARGPARLRARAFSLLARKIYCQIPRRGHETGAQDGESCKQVVVNLKRLRIACMRASERASPQLGPLDTVAPRPSKLSSWSLARACQAPKLAKLIGRLGASFRLGQRALAWRPIIIWLAGWLASKFACRPT